MQSNKQGKGSTTNHIQACCKYVHQSGFKPRAVSLDSMHSALTAIHNCSVYLYRHTKLSTLWCLLHCRASSAHTSTRDCRGTHATKNSKQNGTANSDRLKEHMRTIARYPPSTVARARQNMTNCTLEGAACYGNKDTPGSIPSSSPHGVDKKGTSCGHNNSVW